MSMSTKDYQCSVCEEVYPSATNHYGNHWGKCPKCKAVGHVQVCVDPIAVEKRAEDEKKHPVIKTRINYYSFDVRDQNHEYQNLCKSLEFAGYKKFDTYPAQGSYAALDKVKNSDGDVTLETSYFFNNQWNSKEFGRIHDWREIICPNKNIKMGYWIGMNDEIIELRSSHDKCPYCGKIFKHSNETTECPVCSMKSVDGHSIELSPVKPELEIDIDGVVDCIVDGHHGKYIPSIIYRDWCSNLVGHDGEKFPMEDYTDLTNSEDIDWDMFTDIIDNWFYKDIRGDLHDFTQGCNGDIFLVNRNIYSKLTQNQVDEFWGMI